MHPTSSSPDGGGLKTSWVIAIMAITILICLVIVYTRKGEASRGATDAVYDRVIKSGKIRASYASYPPYCIKDPNTGKFSGIFVEVLEEAGRRLELNVDWTEEVGWGAIFEGLNSDRHDVFGAGIWRNSSRGKVGDFSRPLFYNVIKVYGRPNETRITSLDSIERSGVRIASLDGAIEDVIAKSDFPSNRRVSVPQLNPWSDVLLNITTNRADITFAEPAAVNLFLEKNPGTLKELLPDTPVRVFANTYAFKLGDPKFKAMLDAVLEEIQNDGHLEKVLRRYEKVPGAEFFRVATPYVTSRN